MKNNYTLYCHTNMLNNKKYIGITCQKPENRWGNNGDGYKLQPKFYNSIRKNGWDNFKHEILFSSLTAEEAFKLEQEYIELYETIEKGYNVSLGGYTENKKQVVCLTTNKIYNSVSEAARDNNISASNLSHCLHGDYNTAGNIDGIKLEWRFVVEDFNIDVKLKKEQKEKYKKEKFLLYKEAYLNGETITNIAKRYGTSKETISNILKEGGIEVLSSSKKQRKPVEQYSKNKEYIRRFDSMTEALKSVGYSDNNISRLKKACEEGRLFKGYYWKYEEVFNATYEF